MFNFIKQFLCKRSYDDQFEEKSKHFNEIFTLMYIKFTRLGNQIDDTRLKLFASDIINQCTQSIREAEETINLTWEFIQSQNSYELKKTIALRPFAFAPLNSDHAVEHLIRFHIVLICTLRNYRDAVVKIDPPLSRNFLVALGSIEFSKKLLDQLISMLKLGERNE